MEQHFNSAEAHAAQVKFCAENGIPLFATDRHCFGCGMDIYKQIEYKKQMPDGTYKTYATTGISVEQAGRTHITGCPHCRRSFCD